ncbi:MAG: hypothetical protein A2X59_10985 [Nitrospirae bacterium GWC2_42_7]|nr:MAG: hypothetical protein A2X59_10985 [Nitrospirae bacterium GWC2_42_7]
MMDHKPISKVSLSLTLSDFKQKGLYLIFKDSTVLPLTESNVAEVTRRFWEDPSRISPEVRKHADFHPCAICPEAGNDAICYTLRPVLPFLEDLDRYFSYDRVTAVYRGDEDQILHIAESDMQNALHYICILSFLNYCRVVMCYRKYYHGVIPIMSFAQAVEKIYLNVYWLHKGNKKEISRFLQQFQHDISVTSENATKRLGLICQKDALVNAFYNMRVAVDFLAMEMDNVLSNAFQPFEEKR